MAYISIENVQNGLKSLVMSENKKYSKMIYTYQKSIGMIELNTLSLHNFLNDLSIKISDFEV